MYTVGPSLKVIVFFQGFVLLRRYVRKARIGADARMQMYLRNEAGPSSTILPQCMEKYANYCLQPY